MFYFTLDKLFNKYYLYLFPNRNNSYLINITMMINKVLNLISEKGLKVTPQRLAVLDAINKLNNHPTAENIISLVMKNQPNIGKGTIYRVLETLVDHKIINKVKTDYGIMRYDPVMKRHHHLYCIDSERIEDYEDDELNEILVRYFKKKKIKGFKIEDIKLQILGKFNETFKRDKNLALDYKKTRAKFK